MEDTHREELNLADKHPTRTLDDYKDQFAAGGLKYKPQINEYEVNPHLLASPSFQARLAFEHEYGIVPKREYLSSG